MRFTYRASNWRSRTAVPRTVGGVLVSLGLFAITLVAMVRDLAGAGPSGEAGSLCGWGLLLGLLAAFTWVAGLTVSNALVTTADLELAGDALVVWPGGRWPVRVALADVEAESAAQVVYRLGKAERVKGPLIRPRRKLAAATFIPTRQVSGWRFVFWAVAQMYGGGWRGLGFLVTPDHEGHATLLEQLRNAA
jgi:hypothetical protein